MKKIIITGNVGKDAETGTSKDGTAYVLFSVAVPNGKDKPSDWFDVVCKDKVATNSLQYVKKGMKVYVEGSPSCWGYKDKQGAIVTKITIHAGIIEYLSNPAVQSHVPVKQFAPLDIPELTPDIPY